MQENAASRAWRAQKLQQDREVEQADLDAAVDRFQRNACLISELTEFSSIQGSQSAQSNLSADVTGVDEGLEGDRAGGGLSQERKRGAMKRRSSQHAADYDQAAEEPKAGSQSQSHLKRKGGHSVPDSDMMIESRKRMTTFEDRIGKLSFPKTKDSNGLLLLDRNREPLATGSSIISAESGRPLIESITPSLENGVSDRTPNGEGDGLIGDVLLSHDVTYIKPPPRSVSEVRIVDGNEHVMGAQGVDAWCSVIECLPLHEGSVRRSCQWIAASLRTIQEL